MRAAVFSANVMSSIVQSRRIPIFGFKNYFEEVLPVEISDIAWSTLVMIQDL